MVFRWSKPKNIDFQDIMLKYYGFFENNFGKTILSSITKKHIIKNDFTSSILLHDDNYKKCVHAIYSVFENENIKFVSIFDQNHQNIGYSRVNFCANNDKSNTIIGEIILSDSFDDNQKYVLYLQIIEYFENYIKVYNPDAELLTFEVPQKDLPYFNAVSDKGYKLMKETQQDINISQTYLFDKQIREKNNSRTV